LNWHYGPQFETSTYSAINLMWQTPPYLTIGAEYAYGQRENEDGSDLDNHRIALGFQAY